MIMDVLKKQPRRKRKKILKTHPHEKKNYIN